MSIPKTVNYTLHTMIRLCLLIVIGDGPSLKCLNVSGLDVFNFGRSIQKKKNTYLAYYKGFDKDGKLIQKFYLRKS